MENQEKQRSSFSNSIGFVLAAAGSAVGLGNIWRFPYLAAKDGGGLFLLVYIILALTFGFALHQSNNKVYNYYCPDKLVYEQTGYFNGNVTIDEKEEIDNEAS